MRSENDRSKKKSESNLCEKCSFIAPSAIALKGHVKKRCFEPLIWKRVLKIWFQKNSFEKKLKPKSLNFQWQKKDMGEKTNFFWNYDRNSFKFTRSWIQWNRFYLYWLWKGVYLKVSFINSHSQHSFTWRVIMSIMWRNIWCNQHLNFFPRKVEKDFFRDSCDKKYSILKKLKLRWKNWIFLSNL